MLWFFEWLRAGVPFPWSACECDTAQCSTRNIQQLKFDSSLKTDFHATFKQSKLTNQLTTNLLIKIQIPPITK